MRKFKIVGIQKNEGVYNDKSYVNYYLYYQTLELPKETIGVVVNKLKVNNVIYTKLYESKKAALGFEFDEILYNAYRNVVDIQ